MVLPNAETLIPSGPLWTMEERDREIVKELINAFVKKRQVEQVMGGRLS